MAINFRKFNLASLQRYTSPQAVKDLDSFLDALPINVGTNALIAACFTFLVAGVSVWFTAQELEKVSQLHEDLTNIKALQPPVPVLKEIPVDIKTLKPAGDKIASTFSGIKVVAGAGSVKISAQDSDYFPQFLAAISYLQRSGRNWKVSVNAMCLGRDCKGPQLYADLKVSTITFGEPAKITRSGKDDKKKGKK